MTTKTKWTHKVVKVSRGTNSEWYSHPAAFTGSMDECKAYAETFLREQTAGEGSLRGSLGHRIQVQTRGGSVVQSLRYDY